MFRTMQTSVVLAITLVVVNGNEIQAKPAPSNTTAVSHFKNLPVNTTVFGIEKTGPVYGHGPVINPNPKAPVHGSGSSHDPRGPMQTHGRDFGNWGHRYWNSRYECEYSWSGVYGCYFYFYAPADCYYPVSCIDQFPPVRRPIHPVTTGSPPRFTPVIHETAPRHGR